MAFLRTVAGVGIAFAVLLGAGIVRRSPYYDVACFAHALRTGDADAALRWVDVPSVAASILDTWEEERIGPPGRSPLAPLVRPLLRAAFGLARPLAQRQLEDRIRALVRAIATGAPDAPLHLPRGGGWPVTIAGVALLVRFEGLPDGRVRMRIGWEANPMRLLLARRGDRWVIVALDREWLRAHLQGSPAPRPDAKPDRR